MVKLSHVKAGDFLNLLKSVHKSISVYIKLSGGLGNIQVILKELIYVFKSILIQSFNGVFLKFFVLEHLAESGRQLIDNAAQAQSLIVNDGLFAFKDSAHLYCNL